MVARPRKGRYDTGMDGVPRDREILALALPALGALVAEPLYVLGDTAIVGHLGTVPLAGLALAGLLLSELLGFCTFLEYGTTAKAARLFGARQEADALDVGVQATWLALGLGALLVIAVELAARPATELLGGGATPAVAQAVRWLRIAALGAPFVLVTAAAQGWMRGFQNTRTPLVVIGAANVFSIALSALLIMGFGMGIEGSAIANVTAQTAGGAVFLVLLGRRGVRLGPRLSGIRGQLAAARDVSLRTLSFFVAFTIATGVAARIGTAQLAAQQIGVQLWTFCALFLDSTAIAAQALVGRLLGASAVGPATAISRRLLWAGAFLGCAFALVLAAGYALIPRIFTSDPAVIEQAHVLWPWLVAMMPAAGWVFALDGVLFGAGDLRFLRNVTAVGALGGFVPLSLATAAFGFGLGGIWAGLAAFIAIRTGLGWARWRGRRWVVGGVAMVDEAA
jgi:putative MATE family efflux protein